MTTTVVNMRTDEYDVRIDRATRWGNPFVISSTLTRKQVIAKYATYLADEILAGNITQSDIKSLRDKRLGCWCAPLSCHGDVLAKLADSVEDPPSF